MSKFYPNKWTGGACICCRFYLCSPLLRCILYSSRVWQVYRRHATGSFARFAVFALREVCETTEAYITHNIFSNHKSSLVLSPPVLRLSLRSLPFANVDLISYNHTDKQRCDASGNNRHPKAGALSRWICTLLQSSWSYPSPSITDLASRNRLHTPEPLWRYYIAFICIFYRVPIWISLHIYCYLVHRRIELPQMCSRVCYIGLSDGDHISF